MIRSGTRDLAGWFDFATPGFQIDRGKDGGVIAEWEVRYPEIVAAGDHERSKFYVKLTDPTREVLYRFLFKPSLSPAQAAFNLELASGSFEASLLQVRSRDDYQVLQGVTFTYRTTADAKNYTIQVRNMSLLPRSPQDAPSRRSFSGSD